MTVGPGDPRFGRDGSGGEAGVPEPRDGRSADGTGDAAATGPQPVGPQVPHQRRPPPPPGPPPRPRIVDDPGILGISRLTRGRVGSRLFTLFFVLVFTVIVVQMVAALLDNPW